MNNLKLISPSQTKAFCFVSTAPIRKEASDASEMVSQLLFGEAIEVIEHGQPWIKIRTILDGYEGYVDIKQVLPLTDKEFRRWMDAFSYQKEEILQLKTPFGSIYSSKGSFIGEELSFQVGDVTFKHLTNPSVVKKTIWDDALEYLNAPYLWGGKSIWGIDCSGFVQAVFRIHGFNLPRDAYEQAEIGSDISFEECQENDLAYFSNASGKIIHVGIIGKQHQIMHASGRIRIDALKEPGIWSEEYEKISHTLAHIKRL
jgi:gamma-D-glutamyl-L-lysine dipeptidyl-peptidase